MEILERPLAITDVETTGLDPQKHEIIELGLILVDQKTLEYSGGLNVKIKPVHIELASPEALEINGYNKTDWLNQSISLDLAMEVYARRTKDAIFLAHNVTFDWSFIFEAFKKTGVKNLMDYHKIDLLTLAWFKARELPDITRLNLDALCEYFGIPPEPKPHRAINGVINELEVLKKILQAQ